MAHCQARTSGADKALSVFVHRCRHDAACVSRRSYMPLSSAMNRTAGLPHRA